MTAVSWGPGRIDRFWVDFDGALIHQAFNDGVWAEPESLGGVLASAPTVTAWAVGQMEVFAVLPDGKLWDRYWDGSTWHAWESLGGDSIRGKRPPRRPGAPSASTSSLSAGTAPPGIAGGTAPAGSTGSASSADQAATFCPDAAPPPTGPATCAARPAIPPISRS